MIRMVAWYWAYGHAIGTIALLATGVAVGVGVLVLVLLAL